MEPRKIFTELKIAIKSIVSVKLVLTFMGLFLTLPFFAGLGVVYSIFDASYLGTFGIGPEIFSRPQFSSTLMNIWLFISLLKPFMFMWVIVSIILFIFIVYFIYVRHYSDGTHSTGSIENDVSHEDPVAIKVLESTYKAIPATLIFLLSGLFFVLFIVGSSDYISNKAISTAEIQIHGYFKYKKCLDTFNA